MPMILCLKTIFMKNMILIHRKSRQPLHRPLYSRWREQVEDGEQGWSGHKFCFFIRLFKAKSCLVLRLRSRLSVETCWGLWLPWLVGFRNRWRNDEWGKLAYYIFTASFRLLESRRCSNKMHGLCSSDLMSRVFELSRICDTEYDAY